jgi:signal peptidase II
MLKWLWLSALVLVLDQASKWFMVSWLSLYETVAVMPFFNFTMAHNTGAAFSLLANAGGWQRWFFTIIAIVVSMVMVVWLKRLTANARLEAIAISLMLGGAIGNLIDRLMYGYVIDFVDLYNYFGTYHFPAFNIADSALCIGVTLLIIDTFKNKPEPS